MMKASKLLSIILAIALVFTLCAGVMAEGTDKNDSITVNDAKAGETYNLYKMLDLKVNSDTDPTAFTYTVNADWNAFFAEGGAGHQYVTIEGGYVTAIRDSAALAKAAAAYASKPAALRTETCAENATSVKFDGLANGYYLITSTLGTIAMAETTPDKADVTVNEKNPINNIDKKVKEDSRSGDDAWGSDNDAQIGDTVEFKSEITLLPGTRNVVVTDTMSSGLTLNDNSIAITGLAENQYDLNTDPGEGKTFTITFKDTYLNALTASTTLTLTYSAVLNENAVNGALVAQNNEIVLTYGDGQRIESTTTTTTHKFSVFKHATGATENLAGAEFYLKKGDDVIKLVEINETNYRVAKDGEANAKDTFKTVATGNIVIWGVDADADDAYTLVEKEAPAGYNKLAQAVTVTVNEDNSTCVDVANNTGAELPSTGGMGTTLFYVLGAILVLGAAVILVVRRRMRAE